MSERTLTASPAAAAVARSEAKTTPPTVIVPPRTARGPVGARLTAKSLKVTLVLDLLRLAQSASSTVPGRSPSASMSPVEC